MAIFNKTKKVEKVEKKVEKVKATKVAKKSTNTTPLKEVIIGPRVTEKATLAAENQNMFTFEVTNDANKDLVFKSIVAKYGVNPIKVNIVNLPNKKKIFRGRMGVKSGVKKALVYLKKGDTIKLA